jgi:hypothetical protein
MSYSGTVRCGHCYNSGHNRRGCPDLKKYVEENPDSWRATQYKARQERNAATKRRCSYCAKPGHNRRGCAEFKVRMRDDVYANKKYRRLFVKEVKRLGIGPGALIVRPMTNGGETKDVVCQALDINWSMINQFSAQDRYSDPRFLKIIAIKDMMNPRNATNVSFTHDINSRFCKDIKDVEEMYYGGHWRIASPATSSFEPPADWINDEAPVRANLKDETSPNHYDNRHNT